MKKLLSIVSIIVIFITSSIAQEVQKEVFIIGTMHYVGKWQKNSYKPLYKIAEKYQPEAIYIEKPRAEDSVSIKNGNPRFLALSDSLSSIFTIDEERTSELLEADLNDFTKDDFKYMRNYSLVKRDAANYSYYRYLYLYGMEGALKPLRNENDDITHKLALASNMKHIFSMDDQTTRKEYHKAWRTVTKEGKLNGDHKNARNVVIKLILAEAFPALVNRYGMAANKMNAMKRMHELNSFRYCESKSEAVQKGMECWDGRNAAMARNITEQVRKQNHAKNLVVVGGGHVFGLVEEFQKNYPDIKVRIISQKQLDKMNAEKNNSESIALEGK